MYVGVMVDLRMYEGVMVDLRSWVQVPGLGVEERRS